MFFGYTPRSSVGHLTTMFNVLRNYQILFQSTCTYTEIQIKKRKNNNKKYLYHFTLPAAVYEFQFSHIITKSCLFF